MDKTAKCYLWYDKDSEDVLHLVDFAENISYWPLFDASLVR